MHAVQITRFGGAEVMDVVDLPDPAPGDGEQLFDTSSSGVDSANMTCSPGDQGLPPIRSVSVSRWMPTDSKAAAAVAKSTG
jgi:hypothetical protein